MIHLASLEELNKWGYGVLLKPRYGCSVFT